MKGVASYTVSCGPSRGGGNVALSVNRLESSIAVVALVLQALV